MTLKQIHNFNTDDTNRLQSQLSDFENNVATETKSIRESFIPSLEQRLTTGAAVTSTLLVGQMALCDTGAASVTVVLSAPPNQTPGWLAITKRAAANNVTLVPSGLNRNRVTRRINATTSLVRAAVGVLWIYFDGSDWWA
jgi:hypothetical protein